MKKNYLYQIFLKEILNYYQKVKILREKNKETFYGNNLIALLFSKILIINKSNIENI